MALQHIERVEICIDVFCANLRLMAKKIEKFSVACDELFVLLKQESAINEANEILGGEEE